MKQKSLATRESSYSVAVRWFSKSGFVCLIFVGFGDRLGAVARQLRRASNPCVFGGIKLKPASYGRCYCLTTERRTGLGGKTASLTQDVVFYLAVLFDKARVICSGWCGYKNIWNLSGTSRSVYTRRGHLDLLQANLTVSRYNPDSRRWLLAPSVTASDDTASGTPHIHISCP